MSIISGSYEKQLLVYGYIRSEGSRNKWKEPEISLLAEKVVIFVGKFFLAQRELVVSTRALRPLLLKMVSQRAYNPSVLDDFEIVEIWKSIFCVVEIISGYVQVIDDKKVRRFTFPKNVNDSAADVVGIGEHIAVLTTQGEIGVLSCNNLDSQFTLLQSQPRDCRRIISPKGTNKLLVLETNIIRVHDLNQLEKCPSFLDTKDILEEAVPLPDGRVAVLSRCHLQNCHVIKIYDPKNLQKKPTLLSNPYKKMIASYSICTTNNIIAALSEEKKDVIMIWELNNSSIKFTSLNMKGSSACFGLIPLSNGMIACTYANQLRVYDPKSEKSWNLKLSSWKQIVPLSKGKLAIIFEVEGVAIYDFTNPQKKPFMLIKNDTTCLIETKEEKIIAGTRDGLVLFFDIKKKDKSPYFSLKADKEDPIEHLMKLENGKIVSFTSDSLSVWKVNECE